MSDAQWSCEIEGMHGYEHCHRIRALEAELAFAERREDSRIEVLTKAIDERVKERDALKGSNRALELIQTKHEEAVAKLKVRVAELEGELEDLRSKAQHRIRAAEISAKKADDQLDRLRKVLDRERRKGGGRESGVDVSGGVSRSPDVGHAAADPAGPRSPRPEHPRFGERLFTTDERDDVRECEG